jgi:hypothetical protein
MPDPQESLINAAIEEIEDGAKIKPTALKYGIPRSTLQGRLYGATSKRSSYQRVQILSTEQERLLVSWILHEEASGRGPSRSKARAMAQNIVKAAAPGSYVGKN